jgi:ferritin-like protein
MATQWHAPYELLKPETRDMTRALNSLQEEIEAIDWYNQRVDVTADADLRRTIEHNRDEEKEHAAMVLEWIRRHDPVWDKCLKEYLFTTGDILAVEESSKSDPAQGQDSKPPSSGNGSSSAGNGGLSLTVGSLRGKGGPRRF